jgi:hypothetical protein
MKAKSFSLITAMIALLFPSTSNSKVILQTEMPLFTTVVVPCAARGAGEAVNLVGEVHAVFAVTHEGDGGLHIMIHFNYAGVSGIGLTTGNKYQASGGDHFVSNSGRPGNEFTFVNNFLMTAPGRGNNLRVHELVHVTTDTNGVVTADVDNTTVDCG